VATARGALGLEAVTAIDRTVSGGLEGDFGLLATGRASRGEHLAGPAESAAAAAATATAASAIAAATTAASATASATASAATTITATAATGAIAGSLGSFTGIATGLAALGFVGETALRKPLLLVSSKSKLRATVDAYDSFVLKRHTFSTRCKGGNFDGRLRDRRLAYLELGRDSPQASSIICRFLAKWQSIISWTFGLHCS
jgi:hypothetical protein